MLESIRLPTWWSACGEWPVVELPAPVRARGRAACVLAADGSTAEGERYRSKRLLPRRPRTTVSGPKPAFHRVRQKRTTSCRQDGSTWTGGRVAAGRLYQSRLRSRRCPTPPPKPGSSCSTRSPRRPTRSGSRWRASPRPTTSSTSTTATGSRRSSSSPVQAAYGRAKATHSEFAGRHGMPGRRSSSSRPASRRGARPASSTRRWRPSAEADRALAELQDSMLPVEAGDPELRSGLAAVRERVRGLPGTARELLRTLGR